MLIQASSNIASICNISSKAVNIQSAKSDINGFLVLNSNITKIQYAKSNIASLSSLICNAFKTSYIKSNLTSNSQSSLSTKVYSTTKAHIKCSSKLSCYYFDKDIQVALKSCIPAFMHQSKIFSEILRIQGNELTKENALLKDLSLQFNLETATWGLDYWERDLGIITNTSLSHSQRRDKIKFKLQIRNITITKSFFKSVMDKYYTCNLDEDYNNSKVNVTIVGKRGIPPRLQEMITDAEGLLPAHLVYEFIFTYLPWYELDNSNLTWNDIETYTWDTLLASFL